MRLWLQCEDFQCVYLGDCVLIGFQLWWHELIILNDRAHGEISDVWRDLYEKLSTKRSTNLNQMPNREVVFIMFMTIGRWRHDLGCLVKRLRYYVSNQGDCSLCSWSALSITICNKCEHLAQRELSPDIILKFWKCFSMRVSAGSSEIHNPLGNHGSCNCG